MTKVFILGIDGAPPELIFDKWLDEEIINQGFVKLSDGRIVRKEQ